MLRSIRCHYAVFSDKVQCFHTALPGKSAQKHHIIGEEHGRYHKRINVYEESTDIFEGATQVKTILSNLKKNFTARQSTDTGERPFSELISPFVLIL